MLAKTVPFSCTRARQLAGAAMVVAAIATSTSSHAAEAGFSFGLWGDMPYAKAKDQSKIPALIADMNASDIAFSLYDGDIKDGSSKCTDDVYEAAIIMFSQLKPSSTAPAEASIFALRSFAANS
jgi:hypothetical protein